jgi:hypothetical protein
MKILFEFSSNFNGYYAVARFDLLVYGSRDRIAEIKFFAFTVELFTFFNLLEKQEFCTIVSNIEHIGAVIFHISTNFLKKHLSNF